ncbi:MAG: SDR family NAD(P)-dependent oxidoreductase [Candidatus Omnitrophica bacterium]|nr:SDR family NAD(P)-dependent oxidoreductase [Candidatus Omnitrophota bacterium]
MEIGFKNKTVLITGATRGIGRQIAMDLEAEGANLFLTGTSPSEIKKLNSQAAREKRAIRYLLADFSNKGSLKRFLGMIRPLSIDICVNNAGINRIDLLEDVKEGDWREIVDVNLGAPYRILQTVIPGMKKRGYGRIINISSIFSVVTREKRSVYSMTKSALTAVTRTAAIELAPYGILVNAVSPGFIITDLTEKILGKKERENLVKQVPLRRFGSPGEISKIVLFLASDQNTYLTGQNIVVDGGYTCA